MTDCQSIANNTADYFLSRFLGRPQRKWRGLVLNANLFLSRSQKSNNNVYSSKNWYLSTPLSHSARPLSLIYKGRLSQNKPLKNGHVQQFSCDKKLCIATFLHRQIFAGRWFLGRSKIVTIHCFIKSKTVRCKSDSRFHKIVYKNGKLVLKLIILLNQYGGPLCVAILNIE